MLTPAELSRLTRSFGEAIVASVLNSKVLRLLYGKIPPAVVIKIN